MSEDLIKLIAAASTLGPLALIALVVVYKIKKVRFGGFEITFRGDNK